MRKIFASVFVWNSRMRGMFASDRLSGITNQLRVKVLAMRDARKDDKPRNFINGGNEDSE